MPVSRILYPQIPRTAIIHLGRPLPNCSSSLPENAVPPFSRTRERAVPISFSYLALHREEFTWPGVSPHPPVSSYLTVSPITFEKAGLFSVALVVNVP
jgi:hypothetical protein